MPQRGLRRSEAFTLAGLVVVLALLLTVVFLAVPGHRVAEHPAPPSAATASAPANPYEQQRREGLQRLLDRWAGAVRSDDTAALAALFDPHADPAFRAAEFARADNLRGVPLSDWGYEIGDEPETPVPPEVSDSLGASDAWYPPVSLRYAVAGPDAKPTHKPVALTVARHGDDWFLVSDAPVAGRSTWRGPWDFGPIVTRTVGNSVVLAHPSQAAEADALAAELPTAVPAVTAVWGPDWPQAALIEVAGSQDEFASLAGADRDAGQVAAVTVADAVDPAAHTAAGQRIVFSPAGATRLTDVTRRSVLRHELTHLAARPWTVDGSPLWVLEGFGDYVGYRNQDSSPAVQQRFADIAPTLTAALRSGKPPTALPTDAQFTGPDANLAYEQAWSLYAFVAAEFGADAPKRLYLELAQGPADAARVDAGLHTVLGIDTATLLSRWTDWAQGQIR